MSKSRESDAQRERLLSEARAKVHDAQRELRSIELYLSEQDQLAEEDWLAKHGPALTVDQLREKVADYARQHGAECARLGRAETTGSWKLFRRSLALLASYQVSGR